MDRTDKTGVLNAISQHLSLFSHFLQVVSLFKTPAEPGTFQSDRSPPSGCTLDLPSIQRSTPSSTLATEGKQQMTKEEGFCTLLIN